MTHQDCHSHVYVQQIDFFTHQCVGSTYINLIEDATCVVIKSGNSMLNAYFLKDLMLPTKMYNQFWPFVLVQQTGILTVVYLLNWHMDLTFTESIQFTILCRDAVEPATIEMWFGPCQTDQQCKRNSLKNLERHSMLIPGLQASQGPLGSFLGLFGNMNNEPGTFCIQDICQAVTGSLNE